MLSTSTASNLADQVVIDQAVQLLQVVYLSAQDQLTIEHAIGLIAVQKNCSRHRAAQILHKRAFPN